MPPRKRTFVKSERFFTSFLKPKQRRDAANRPLLLNLEVLMKNHEAVVQKIPCIKAGRDCFYFRVTLPPEAFARFSKQDRKTLASMEIYLAELSERSFRPIIEPLDDFSE